MKFLVKKYRVISIWLSLAILALAFFIASDEGSRAVCVPIIFLLGTFLYLAGGIREWALNHMPTLMVEVILGFFMFTAAVESFLRLGGFV